jgi:cytochrome c oxidase subunit 1
MSTVAHVHEEDHGHHHKETFMTKYIFSQDHKMIAKQYLITGLFMGIIGIAMSLLFRIQLAWPEQSFAIFECLFSLSNHSRYHYGILCIDSRIKWYF